MSAKDLVAGQIAIINQFGTNPEGETGQHHWMLADKADAASLAVAATKALIDAGLVITAASHTQ